MLNIGPYAQSLSCMKPRGLSPVRNLASLVLTVSHLCRLSVYYGRRAALA